MSGTTTSPVCDDAGILVRLLTGHDNGTARGRWERRRVERRSLVAPPLLRNEVTNALHRPRRADAAGEDVARDALRSALDLPVDRADEPGVHVAALSIAPRFRLPAVDHARSLALSEREGVNFWTTDRRLTNVVRQTPPWVHRVAPRYGPTP